MGIELIGSESERVGEFEEDARIARIELETENRKTAVMTRDFLTLIIGPNCFLWHFQKHDFQSCFGFSFASNPNQVLFLRSF